MEHIEEAKKVEELVQKLLDIMGFSARVATGEPISSLQGAFIVRVSVDDYSNLLIGQRGLNLESFQHVVRMIARRSLGIDASFLIDVNSYLEDKSRSIIRDAQEAAIKAERDRNVVLLPPMSSMERKIVHTELAKNPNVITESIGEGPDRKVAIKAAPIVE